MFNKLINSTGNIMVDEILHFKSTAKYIGENENFYYT